MASQQTPNYQLSRWKGTDRVLMEEFNDNWDKIDTAIKSNAGAIAAEVSARESGDSTLRTTLQAALSTEVSARESGDSTLRTTFQAALAKCGNCQIFVGAFTGDGSAARTLSFSGKPLFVLVTTADGHRKNRSLTMIRGTSKTYADVTDTNSVTGVSWTDTSVTFETPNTTYGMNAAQTKYLYMALLEK